MASLAGDAVAVAVQVRCIAILALEDWRYAGFARLAAVLVVDVGTRRCGRANGGSQANEGSCGQNSKHSYSVVILNNGETVQETPEHATGNGKLVPSDRNRVFPYVCCRRFLRQGCARTETTALMQNSANEGPKGPAPRLPMWAIVAATRVNLHKLGCARGA